MIQTQPIRDSLEPGEIAGVMGNWGGGALSHWAESGASEATTVELGEEKSHQGGRRNQRQRPDIVQGTWIKPHLKADPELSI